MRNEITLNDIIKSLDETLQEKDQQNLEALALDIDDLLTDDIDDLLTDDPELLISDDNPYK